MLAEAEVESSAEDAGGNEGAEMPRETYGIKFNRLCSAITDSRRRMEPMRRNRIDAVRQLVGTRYSDNGAPKEVYINEIERMMQAYTRSLAAHTPNFLVSSLRQELKAQARDLQEALNFSAKEMNLLETIRLGVAEAILGLCVAKVGINFTSVDNIDGFTHDSGMCFADVVDPDDFVIDMAANRWDKITFIGNRFREPADIVKNCGLYYPEVVAKLVNVPLTPVNDNGTEKANTALNGVGNYSDREYLDFYELYDLFLPLENVVVTLGCSADGLPQEDLVLRVVTWKGPRRGPYRVLSLFDVPGNLLPLAPSATMLPLHELVNSNYRKTANQADRQKALSFTSGTDEETNRIKNANDGDIIRAGSPQTIIEKSFGGPNQQVFAIGVDARQQFSDGAGNLNVISGISSEADTAHQEELLNQNSSKRLADMSERIEEWVRGIGEDIAFYLYHDPTTEIPIQKAIPGTNLSVQSVFSASRLKGEFLDHAFSVQPYSMEHKTPQMKAKAIIEVLSTVVMPLGQVLEAQGITINGLGLMETLSDLLNLPELKDVLTTQIPMDTGQGSGPSSGGQGGVDGAQASPWASAQQQRPQGQQKKYVRTSSGMSQAGQAKDMVNRAMSAGAAQNVA